MAEISVAGIIFLMNNTVTTSLHHHDALHTLLKN